MTASLLTLLGPAPAPAAASPAPGSTAAAAAVAATASGPSTSGARDAAFAALFTRLLGQAPAIIPVPTQEHCGPVEPDQSADGGCGGCDSRADQPAPRPVAWCLATAGPLGTAVAADRDVATPWPPIPTHDGDRLAEGPPVDVPADAPPPTPSGSPPELSPTEEATSAAPAGAPGGRAHPSPEAEPAEREPGASEPLRPTAATVASSAAPAGAVDGRRSHRAQPDGGPPEIRRSDPGETGAAPSSHAGSRRPPSTAGDPSAAPAPAAHRGPPTDDRPVAPGGPRTEAGLVSSAAPGTAGSAPPPARVATADGAPASTPVATTGSAPAGTADPPDAEAAPATLAQRIADAVELLEHAPPPRRLTLDLGEVRLSVSLRGETVRVTFLAGYPDAAGELDRELTNALAARGLHFGGLGQDGTASAHHNRSRGDDPARRGQQPPDGPPTRRKRPSIRPAAPGVQL